MSHCDQFVVLHRRHEERSRLKLDLKGNTDNVCGHGYNVKLADARVEMVVATLEKEDIVARLKATVRILTKPASDSDQLPATHSDFIPAGIPI
jgi:hypothetical protein